MGVAPVISYNYGKQDEKQLKNVFSICMRFIVFVSVTVFAITLIFGSPLVGTFAEKGTPVYEIARNGFLIFPFMSKKSCLVERDILPMSMNTHII